MNSRVSGPLRSSSRYVPAIDTRSIAPVWSRRSRQACLGRRTSALVPGATGGNRSPPGGVTEAPEPDPGGASHVRSVARLLAATLLLASLGAISAAPVAAGGGCHGSDGTVHTEGDATVVRMGPCSFSPTVVHVPVGTQVRFLNTAEVDHMVVGEAQSWGAVDVVAPGTELSRAFATKGVYPYSCPLHPGMVGAVVVGGGDAAAVPPAAAAAGSSSVAAQPAAAAPAGAETADHRRDASRRPASSARACSCWPSSAARCVAPPRRPPTDVAGGLIRIRPGPRPARPLDPTDPPRVDARRGQVGPSASTSSAEIAASRPPEVCGSWASATSSGATPSPTVSAGAVNRRLCARRRSRRRPARGRARREGGERGGIEHQARPGGASHLQAVPQEPEPGHVGRAR